MDIKPSQIMLSVPPLVDTMKRAKREFAAALVVRVCQESGDEWKPVTLERLIEVLAIDKKEKKEPIFSLLSNPFFRPDFHMLADGEFARWTGEPGESEIEFTEKGYQALSKWKIEDRIT